MLIPGKKKELLLAIINKIRKKVASKEYEFAIPHFFEEMANDNLIFADIEIAIANGQIERKFSRDQIGMRYEIIGSAGGGRKIAIICRIKDTGKLLFITIYALRK